MVEDELTGYEEHLAHEAGTGYDDKVERYGDPCPVHRTLRWGGDCGDCELAWMNAEGEGS